ncbi:helix-turn-helix domain-containing protein [Actinophytocola sp.]|uniref:winged helix-turn-helix transcriptional regulator n=1 Tax=Actinophytocola sp. TaxID=1872138 RepID=UPI002ED45D71
MRRTSFARWPCSIARTMDLLGDQWTLLVLREAFNGVRRFDQLQAELGIARNTLTERLDRLTGAGLLDRVRYQDRPARYEYPLTEMGRDFFPVMAAIIRWGDEWLADETGPPRLLRHLDCGKTTTAAVSCVHCGGPMTADHVVMEPGPGTVP